jgi:hypothetical protein
MNLMFECPYCRAALEVPPLVAGKPVRCPFCQGQVAAPFTPDGASLLKARPPLPNDLLLTRKQLFRGILGLFLLGCLLFLVGLLIGYYS